MSYTDSHKYLLQIITRERLVKEDKLKIITKQLFKDHKTSLEEALELINNKLRTLNLKIRKVVCEVNGSVMYVLYTDVKPKVNLLESSLTLSQKEYLMLLFKGIITSKDGQITTSTALNYANDLQNRELKLIEAEQLVNDFIKNNLLMYTDKNQRCICFTPLTMVEMESEFRESFPDLTDCLLCKQLILKGVSCDNCSAKIHSHCLKTFASKIKGVLKCVECQMPFTSAS